MKRFLSWLLVLVMIVLQGSVCFAREVSTYDILLNMDPVLIERFQEGGLSEEMIRSFMGVLDEEADMVTFDQAFQEEVVYIAETGRVPQSMEIFFLSVMGNSIAYVPPVGDDPEEEPEPTPEPTPKPTPTPAPPFEDLAGYDWAIPSISYLKEHGYIAGYPNGTFQPEAPITRAELCYLVTKAFLDESYSYESSRYPDVDTEAWYYGTLLTAEYFSLFQWIYEENFCPDEFVTRQEMCAVIYRAYRRTQSTVARLRPRYEFLDFAQISNYAYDPIQSLQQAGCVSGYDSGEFLPLKLATRAEVAKVIASVIQLPYRFPYQYHEKGNNGL